MAEANSANDDLKAKMREALERKQAHDHPDDAAGHKARRTVPRSPAAPPRRCTGARPAAAAPERPNAPA